MAETSVGKDGSETCYTQDYVQVNYFPSSVEELAHKLIHVRGACPPVIATALYKLQ
jgi:hypothetical protein